jgi:hypothetical protein
VLAHEIVERVVRLDLDLQRHQELVQPDVVAQVEVQRGAALRRRVFLRYLSWDERIDIKQPVEANVGIGLGRAALDAEPGMDDERERGAFQLRVLAEKRVERLDVAGVVVGAPEVVP